MAVARHRRQPSVILAARRIPVVLRFMPGHLAPRRPAAPGPAGAGYLPEHARPADVQQCELPETCPLLEHMYDRL